MNVPATSIPLRRYIPLAFVICLGIVASIASYHIIRHVELQDIENKFNLDAQNRINAIKREIVTHLEVIQGLHSLYLSSQEVTRSEFREYTKRTLLRHQNIQALEWSPRVREAERESYEQSARADGLAGFQFTEHEGHGKIIRAGKRAEYFPVYFAEPYKGNEAALGFDLASDPVRLEAMKKSASTGDMVITPRITLVQEERDQHGLIAFLPLYRKGSAVETARNNSGNLVGFVLGTFKIHDIMEKSYAYLQRRGIDIYLLDTSGNGKDKLLYHTSPKSGNDKLEEKSRFIMSQSFNVADHEWTVVAKSTSAYLTGSDNWHAWSISAGLMFIVCLLGMYLKNTLSRTHYIEHLLGELSSEITERKQSETALRLSEEKFSKAFRSSPTLVTITTLTEGRFVDVNNSFLDMSGYSRDDVIGHTAQELQTWENPSDRMIVVNHLQQHGAMNNFETRIRIKGGEIRNVLYSAEMIEVASSPCIIAVILDITERKKLEKQLLHSQKMEAVGQLAGGIAHDFNNILTAIISYSYLAKNRLDKDSPLLDNINKILSLSDRASQITRGLLTFSRKEHFELKPVDLNEVVGNVEKIISKFIGEDITVTTELTSDKPTIIADRTQIEQILMNLATNARDAMPEGGSFAITTESLKIGSNFITAHGFGKAGMYAVITVSDTGAGMDKDTAQKVFEPFYTTKEVGKGTGLGLAIIYGIVKQHNGYITVYSEEGKGTAFKIFFPATKVPVEHSWEEEHVDLRGNGQCILVAEDEEPVRNSMKTMLQEFNYRVIEAVDGKDAVEKYMDSKDLIDLLIIDVIMPGMNGKEVHDAVKKVNPDVQVIFTSGYTADIVQRKNIIQDNDTFLSKPIAPARLLSQLKDMLQVGT